MASIYYGNNKYSGAGCGATIAVVKVANANGSMTLSTHESVSTGTFYYVKITDL